MTCEQKEEVKWKEVDKNIFHTFHILNNFLVQYVTKISTCDAKQKRAECENVRKKVKKLYFREFSKEKWKLNIKMLTTHCCF